MFAPNDELRSGSLRPSSINISRTENNDALQSHLSMPRSSKRLRVPPALTSLTLKENNQDGADPSDQHTLNSKRIDFRGSSVNAHEASTLAVSNIIRSERTRISHFARYALLFYCFISCVVVTFRLYVFCKSPDTTGWNSQLPVNDNPSHVRVNSMTGYLTKAISGTTYFEPYVLSNGFQNDSISLVGWLHDSEIDLIRTWMNHWPGWSIFSMDYLVMPYGRRVRLNSSYKLGAGRFILSCPLIGDH